VGDDSAFNLADFDRYVKVGLVTKERRGTSTNG
jgi:hypothetical protein